MKKSNPSLWGEQQPRDWLEKNLILALFKDMSGDGYTKVVNSVNLGIAFNHRTFQHNAKVLRGVGMKWGEETCKLGEYSDWKSAMRQIKPLPSSFKKIGALLYQDSSDFKLQRKKGRGPSSEFWSGKIHAPARRFQFLRNAKGKIIKAWGGYSPKIMDSIFLDFKKQWIRKNLANANIAADSHYKVGKKIFKEVHYLTPLQISQSSKSEEEPDQDSNKTMLPSNQRKFNKDLREIRGRVEHPFAWMKNRFNSLKFPWGEDPEQLDALVWMAIGAYNYSKE